MSEEQAIRDGERIEAFLADETVQAAMQRVKGQAYDAFIAAKSTDEMVAAKAKFDAAEAFETALRATVDRGTFAKRLKGPNHSRNR
jgi:hypothetical protein